MASQSHTAHEEQSIASGAPNFDWQRAPITANSQSNSRNGGGPSGTLGGSFLLHDGCTLPPVHSRSKKGIWPLVATQVGSQRKLNGVVRTEVVVADNDQGVSGKASAAFRRGQSGLSFSGYREIKGW